MQKGPVAPKDPTRKRPFFYTIHDKDIFATKQPDGKGIQFIYQNDNRLINSAQIAGNVSDSEILELLKTTAGFRKLVHSIGVSVVEPTAKEKVTFVFQMYGKTDPNVSGTSIKKEMIADGTEVIIPLDSVDWSEDDNEPGQIRFEFENPGVQAIANVRMYLQDGFQAPECIVDEKIDCSSPDYSKMIERSLMQMGNAARLQRAIKKAQKGEEVTVAYIGGSITQGAGAIPINEKCYAYQSYKAFAERFGNGSNVHFVKAGVGGTPSELGMVRFERDVLKDGTVSPDIVVVEFAVNDEGDETNGVCYESLVRKILQLPNQPAVVLLFAVFSYDWNLQERLAVVGERYELPMVSVKDAVTAQFRLRKEEGRVLSKNQFFYDIYHPSNMGHQIMSDCLKNLWEKAAACECMEDRTAELLLGEPAIGKTYEKVKLLDRKQSYEKAEIQQGSFTGTDTELQRVERDDKLEQIPEFAYNWYREGAVNGVADYFEMTITCRALVLICKDSGAMDFGKAQVFVDGTLVLTADPHKNGWTHCNPLIIFEDENTAEHVVRIQMAEEDLDKKFTILGFGYVE